MKQHKNMKMEAICSSETYVDFQRITQRYIPEDIVTGVGNTNLTTYIYQMYKYNAVKSGKYLKKFQRKRKGMCTCKI
jgi:hypothetical protein